MLNLVEYLSKATSTKPGTVRLFLMMMFGYPLGWIYVKLSRNKFFSDHIDRRHILMSSFGFSQLLYVFGIKGTLTTILYSVLIPWVIIYSGRYNMFVKYIPAISFIWGLGGLTIYNYRHYGERFSGENLSTYMILAIIKYTTLSSDVKDLVAFESPPPSMAPGTKSHSRCMANAVQKKSRSIKKHPTFIEYMGHMLLVPGLYTGPVVPFQVYCTYIEECPKLPLTRKSPRRYAAIKKFFIGIGFLLAWILLNPSNLKEHINTLANTPIIHRLFGYFLLGFMARCKYYCVWTLSDSCFNFMGLGQEKEEKGESWNKFTNVYPLKIETAPNFRSVVKNWNKATAQWMHQDIYTRLPFSSHQKTIRSTVTFLISALWHGLEPGYYYSFMTGSLITVIERLRWNRTKEEKTNYSPLMEWLIYVGKVIITQMLLMYVMIPFTLLDQCLILDFYKSLGYFGHIFIIMLLLFYF